jgi:hypothetical protein
MVICFLYIFCLQKSSRAVEGHFAHPYGREWVNITDTVTPLLAELVGKYYKILPEALMRAW